MNNFKVNSKICRNLQIVVLILFLSGLAIMSNFHPTSASFMVEKPPDEIRGGKWSDDFLTNLSFEGKNVEATLGHLELKLDESLHWIQTWNYHFMDGEFLHTEAVSDSVRLTHNGEDQYFTTGVYRSIVLNAGKPVDWSSSKWTYSHTPQSLVVEYRTGDTPIPDQSWTGWQTPTIRPGDYMCVYTINSEITECESNLNGISSSQFIQYRLSFDSDSPLHTVALYDIDILYGTHALSGTAWSIIVPPADLSQWESVILTSTVPADTQLTLDILAEDGTLLLHDVEDDTSLLGIDPGQNPSLQLYASFSTTDPSHSPDIDLWGLTWKVKYKIFIPVVLR